MTKEHCNNFTFWIGASDELEEDNWIFGNGIPVTWTNWLSGEPSNLEGNEHQVAVDQDGKWKADNALELQHSVCKRGGHNTFTLLICNAEP